MIRTFFMACIFVAAAFPSLAARCNKPYAPTVSDGAAMTEEQIRTMRDDIKTFIEASDIYQKCLGDAALLEGPGGKSDSLIDENQHEKERVSAAFNSTLTAYKAGHH